MIKNSVKKNSKVEEEIKINKLNLDSPQYNKMTILISPTVISQIYSQLCSSFADFYGFLIGRTKITKISNKNDNIAKFENKELYILIESVIFVYQKNYLQDKLDKLLEKVTKKSLIIGLFSARNNSYPNLSLRDQEIYFKVKKYNYNITNPLLFGCFCQNRHSSSEIETIDFNSKIYILSEKNEFVSMPYEILNMKDTTYSNKLNIFSTKQEVVDFSVINSTVISLKKKISEQVKQMELKLQPEIVDLSNQISEEIEHNRKLIQKITFFET